MGPQGAGSPSSDRPLLNRSPRTVPRNASFVNPSRGHSLAPWPGCPASLVDRSAVVEACDRGWRGRRVSGGDRGVLTSRLNPKHYQRLPGTWVNDWPPAINQARVRIDHARSLPRTEASSFARCRSSQTRALSAIRGIVSSKCSRWHLHCSCDRSVTRTRSPAVTPTKERGDGSRTEGCYDCFGRLLFAHHLWIRPCNRVCWGDQLSDGLRARLRACRMRRVSGGWLWLRLVL